jgi:5-formyltetrahydrofolate cyclo-ligase
VGALKSELRRRIRSARAARGRSDDPQLLLDAARHAGLLDPEGRPGHVGAVTIAAYVASPGEPDPAAIREAVRAAGGRVLLPIPRSGRRLEWALDEGRYAMDATLPVQVPSGPVVGEGAACLVAHRVSLVLAPALAVDRTGARLGQGGGFYDTVLAELARAVEQDPIRVAAVVHDDEVLAGGQIPRDAHDVAVAEALTTSGVIRLGDG